MTAFLVPLLGLIGKLVEIGAKAYQDAQKQHDDVVAAYETALNEAKGLLDQLKSEHDARMKAAQDAIAAASAPVSSTTHTVTGSTVVNIVVDPSSDPSTNG